MLTPDAYTHRVTIQQKQTIPGPMGPETTWVDAATRWARTALVSLDGRAKYQQVGHSEVARQFGFPGAVSIAQGQHRLIWRGETFEPIEPPGDYSGVGTETVVTTKRVTG